MKKKNLHTSFVKFIIEKYNKNEEIPDEETNMPDEKLIDEIDINDEDEVQYDENIINNLIKEYEEMEKKYKNLKNDKIYNKKQ
jgi:hypothetical protein